MPALVRLLLAAMTLALATSARADEPETYQAVPMPPGFQVLVNPLEGPVFADAQGRTLYQWPRKGLRNGPTGDGKGSTSQCTDVVRRETAGLQSPWPPGLLLPDLETRHSCVQEWPPVLAQAAAKPIGKWTIVARPEGTRQWAFDGY